MDSRNATKHCCDKPLADEVAQKEGAGSSPANPTDLWHEAGERKLAANRLVIARNRDAIPGSLFQQPVDCRQFMEVKHERRTQRNATEYNKRGN